MKHSLVIFLTACLVFSLCAGCITKTPNVKPDPQSPLTLNAITNTTKADSQVFWINIDPISDHNIGDLLIISGTTNLEESDELLVQVIPEWWSDVKKRSQCAGREIADQSAIGIIYPIPGNNTSNSWNFTINSSTFPAQNYYIYVNGVKRIVTAQSSFHLIGNSSMPVYHGCR
jgi:hypothetical protein